MSSGDFKKLLVFLIPMLTFACALSQTTVNVAVGMESEAASGRISPPAAQTIGTEQTCRITALKTLNLRAGAGTFAEVIGTLSHDQTVTILPVSPSSPTSSVWLHVRVGDQEGWINSKYCQGK
jgi:uncharacterized protein YgiM (DUF1202 family)